MNPYFLDDEERTGAIIETLAYAGQKHLTPALYEKNLKGISIRDEDSAAMRTSILSMIDGVDIFAVTEDEYFCLFVDESATEAVEYELRKAERRDGYCDWKKIKA